MRYTCLLLISFFAFLSTQAQVPSPSFDHQAILVKDLSTSANFYAEILHLHEIENKTGLDHIRWFALGKGTELHIIESSEFQGPPAKGIHLALKTPDLDGLMGYLKSRKVYFENWDGEPGITNTRADGIRQIYLQDPDGYWIEINEHE